PTLQKVFSTDNTNFLYTIKNEDGEVILSNYNNQEVQLNRTYTFEEAGYWEEKENINTPKNWEEGELINSPEYVEGETYTIDCYVKRTLTAEDRYFTAERWIQIAYSMRYTLIIVTILSFLIAIILFIFLMCSAGHRKGKEEVIPNGLDKIPFDIFLAGILAIAFISIALLDNIYSWTYYMSITGHILIIGAALIMTVPLLLLAFMSFATRYKLGGWWKNTIVYRLLYSVYKVIRRLVLGAKYLLAHISILWKAILGLLTITIFELFIMAAAFPYNGEILVLFWLLGKLIFIPIILYIIISLQKLLDGSQEIANGDLNHHIDTKRLLWDFKRYGENLNNISSGMSNAVEERMKSERLKTELITNVSHDIKTPLTSIINYVDLIKREEIEDVTIKEYVDVLDRQSSRLKKLIDDLVDASKASTGNLAVNSARTEVGVLLTQTTGEYEEKMKDNNLELVLNQPEEEIFIMADGRLLWRVFDNLMGNIYKYSQPGTRAYLSLEKSNGRAIITFRNISKYALNISSDELMERFVRGDSSRTTEGSGLGLSIAKSLVELQKGELNLLIDGDLFKVVLTFNTVA
ncbi:MAG: sensor histidine kinase, partial [Clostridiales bacterium]|nr:sensor histidine kinase [Clostridiales bacterium]